MVSRFKITSKVIIVNLIEYLKYFIYDFNISINKSIKF